MDGNTKKKRRTKAEMAKWREDLRKVLEEIQPATLRQLFYRCVSAGFVTKDENAYTNLSWEFVQFRKQKLVPWDWLVDNTRKVYGPNRGWTGVEHAKQQVRNELQKLRDRPYGYWRDYWHDRDFGLSVWIEKDALAATLHDVVDRYQVPLYVARGFSSKTFIHDAAEVINETGKPAHILYLADYDPSGVAAMHAGIKGIKELCTVEITWKQVAVTREQIDAWNLPTRPTKQVRSHGKNWTDPRSVELDAIPPDQFKRFVADTLAEYLPPEEIARQRAIADVERKELRIWIDSIMAKVGEEG